MLLALALRLLRLDFQPLWWDEGYSVWFATHPLSQMAALTAEDIHPPLYYALLRGWTQLWGAGPVPLRLLSVAFGTLTIPAIYFAGRRLFPKSRAPLLAAFLLTVNPFHIFYSQEVRMYGLVALLSVGVIAAAWRVLRTISTTGRLDAGRASWLALLSYIFLTAAALYTQYYAVFLPIGLTFYVFWHWRRDRPALVRWLAVQAATALLYLPWVLYAAPKLVSYVGQKIVADADKPLGIFLYFARHLAAFGVGHLERPLAAWWPAALALLLPIVAGLWLRSRSLRAPQRDAARTELPMSPGAQHAVPMLATTLLTALAFGWLISLRAPFFPERGERLLILALPPFVLLAAAGMDTLRARCQIAAYLTAGLMVAASIASLTAFFTAPRYADDDYRALIARTVEQGLPGDTVFCIYPWQVGYWRSYAPPNGPVPVISPDPEWSARVAASLENALQQGRVWFPADLAHGAILETEIEAYLIDRSLPFVNEWHGPNTRLSAWASEAAHPVGFTKAAPQDGLPFRFAAPGDGMLSLQAASGSTEATPAANAVTPIVLAWQAGASPPALAVSVRLSDDLGQIWAQHDYEWRAAGRLGLLIPAGTPPGRYHVELVVQPKGSDRAIDALASDGRVLGPAARLFDLDVTAADRELTPERLPIAKRRTVDLADGLRFLGHSAESGPLTPGELRKVSLFWQSWGQPDHDYVAFVQVLGRDGAPVALWEAPPGAASPTTAWAPGTLMRTQASFRIPASTPDGSYRLIAGLFRATDKARLRTASGAEHIALGTVAVRGRPHRTTPPQPQQPADVAFGSVARLAGYDLAAPETRGGSTLALTLHWQALGATDRAYTVFVHLVDETGAVRGYGDAEPGGGAFPTPGWLAGEYLADAHSVVVAPDATPGTYRLVVGLYDPASGERLRMPDGGDQLVLETPIRVQSN